MSDVSCSVKLWSACTVEHVDSRGPKKTTEASIFRGGGVCHVPKSKSSVPLAPSPLQMMLTSLNTTPCSFSSPSETKLVGIRHSEHAPARGCSEMLVCQLEALEEGKKRKNLWKCWPSERLLLLLGVSGELVCCEAERWPGKRFHPWTGSLSC